MSNRSCTDRSAAALYMVALGVVAQGCEGEILNVNCPDAGSASAGPAVVVRLTDANGNPAALGTTVRLEGPGPDQAATGRDPDGSVITIGNRPGTFDVTIVRPWWNSPPARTVRIPTPRDICDGFQTTHLFATLELRPEAPDVRQVVPESEHISVTSDPPFSGRNAGSRYGRTHLRAFVEADPTASTALEWIATERQIADVTPDGIMTVSCRERPIDTHIVVRSRADPTVSASVRVTVEGTTLLACP